jgi:hypothetical protein
MTRTRCLALLGLGCGAVFSLSACGLASGSADSAQETASEAEVTQWVYATEGSASTTTGGVSALPDGGCVAVGMHSGSLSLGTSESPDTLFDAVDDDSWIARFTEAGDMLWATTIAGPGATWAYGVETLPDASTVVVGGFDGSATFGGPIDGIPLEAAADGESMFVARFDADGRALWALAIGADASWAEGFRATALPGGGFAVSGALGAPAVFGQGGPNETLLDVAGGVCEGFVAVFEDDGRLRWARALASDPGDSTGAWAVAPAPDGGVTCTGNFQGTVRVPLASGGDAVLVSTEGSIDVFVVQFDAAGGVRWAKSFGGPRSDDVFALATAPDGSCRVVGTFVQQATFDPAGSDASKIDAVATSTADGYVAAYQADGSFHWVQHVGSDAWSAGYAVAVLADGTTYAAGAFQGRTDHLAVAGDEPLSSPETAGWLAVYAPDGTAMWVGRAHGPGTAYALGVEATVDHGVYVVGAMSGEMTFDDERGNFETVAAQGPSAGFIVHARGDGIE